MIITSIMEDALRRDCGNPASPLSLPVFFSLFGMRHSIARQKFRTKFHKCQRNGGEREREWAAKVERTSGRLWHKFSCDKLWSHNWHMSCTGIARCPSAQTGHKPQNYKMSLMGSWVCDGNWSPTCRRIFQWVFFRFVAWQLCASKGFIRAHIK